MGGHGHWNACWRPVHLCIVAVIVAMGCSGTPHRSGAGPELRLTRPGPLPEPDLTVVPRSDDPDVAACEARWKRGPAENAYALPGCIQTAKGVMSVEDEYLPGVVECELGGAHRAPAALRAQAVAARTYLLAHLKRKARRKGAARKGAVKIGPHFQCWKPAKRPTSVQAVADTEGVVMVRGGAVLDANYVSGTRKRNTDCTPQPPEDSGFDYDSWPEMRKAYYASKKRGRRLKFKGRYWTEILVTDNGGKQGDEVEGTPMAPARGTNRGAMSQYGAICHALRRGLDAPDILRQFYGLDVGFYGDFRPGAPTAPAPDEEIPDIEPHHEPLPDLDLEALTGPRG